MARLMPPGPVVFLLAVCMLLLLLDAGRLSVTALIGGFAVGLLVGWAWTVGKQ